LSPPEKQLIAAFAQRIGELDPTSPLRPRIEGLGKLLWTVTQVGLGQAEDGLHHLARAGIPFVLLKDGALHAEKLTASWRPLAGDVAILVPHEAMQRAVGALADAGWAPAGDRMPSQRRRLERGIGLVRRNGGRGRINLHITAFRGLSPRTADRAVWQGARPATLGALPVLIPDPADAILIDLTYASLGSTADWAHRVSARVAHQPVDWNRLTDTAGRDGLVLSCLGGLDYLRDVLAVPVPETVLSILRAAPLRGTAWLAYFANERDRGDRRLLPRAMAYAARRLLYQQGRWSLAEDRPAR
jgi:hypothetical protein